MSEANWAEEGAKIKELRMNKEGKPSVHKAARALHISGNYLSEIERGVKCPSEIVLHSIANYYEVDEVDLCSLYGKTVKENMEFIISNPTFHKTMTQIATDKRLTDGERNQIVDEMANLYKEFIKKRSKNE